MTTFETWRAGDVKKAILGLLNQMFPNTKLQDFKNSTNRGVRQINPPRDGIAYACEYLMDIPHMIGVPGGIKIEQFWDKDGNCIGFMFDGRNYMFDKEKLPEQGQEKNTQSQDNKENVPLESDLVRDMTRAVGENNNMEIYGTEVLAIEPAIDGVAFAQKARGVTDLARNGSNVLEKSVWFDVVRLYDAKGTFLGMHVTDDNLFDEYDVANSGLVKADAKTIEMIKKANKKLEAVRDANGSIIGLDLITISKKQQFERGHVLVTEMKTQNIPKDSELAKYLEQYPDAILTQGPGGWSTELPKDLYPDLWPFQRIQMWNKDGKPGPALKGMQKEM